MHYLAGLNRRQMRYDPIPGVYRLQSPKCKVRSKNAPWRWRIIHIRKFVEHPFNTQTRFGVSLKHCIICPNKTTPKLGWNRSQIGQPGPSDFVNYRYYGQAYFEEFHLEDCLLSLPQTVFSPSDLVSFSLSSRSRNSGGTQLEHHLLPTTLPEYIFDVYV